MYRTKAIYQLSDLKQSSWKILRLFEIYRQSGSQAPVTVNRLQVLNHSFERMKKNCINVYIYLERTKELILLILLYLCGFLIHVYNVWKKEPCLMHKTWLCFPYIVNMY